MKLVIATSNKDKMTEIKEIMADLDLEILSMAESGIDLEIEETGTTFEQNAIIKAEAIAKLCDCMVMADDSGLEIDYLNKQPGVYSARYLGHDTPYSVKNMKIIDMLENVELKKRTARFVCSIAVAVPNGQTLVTTATFEGYIGYKPQGENGFGYDPIFYVPEYKMSSAEMDRALKNSISHRGKAIKEMKVLLREYLGKEE